MAKSKELTITITVPEDTPPVSKEQLAEFTDGVADEAFERWPQAVVTSMQDFGIVNDRLPKVRGSRITGAK